MNLLTVAAGVKCDSAIGRRMLAAVSTEPTVRDDPPPTRQSD